MPHVAKELSLSTILRAAEPRDAALLGWASVAAARSQLARGWFDIVLERDDSFVMEFAKQLALASAKSWWHWSRFEVAEIDGKVVSAMCGFADSAAYELSGAAMAEASERMGIDKREQAQLWPRGAFIVSAATSEPGAWTVENVATLPEFRGRGLVQALLMRQLDLARAKGCARAQISIFIGNASAER